MGNLPRNDILIGTRDQEIKKWQQQFFNESRFKKSMEM